MFKFFKCVCPRLNIYLKVTAIYFLLKIRLFLDFRTPSFDPPDESSSAARPAVGDRGRESVNDDDDDDDDEDDDDDDDEGDGERESLLGNNLDVKSLKRQQR